MEDGFHRGPYDGECNSEVLAGGTECKDSVQRLKAVHLSEQADIFSVKGDIP